VPGWKRITVGPVSQTRHSDLGRCQGRRRSPSKKQNKTGLEARLVEPQTSSSESKEEKKKATFYSERGCPCSAFLAVQRGQAQLGQGSRTRASRAGSRAPRTAAAAQLMHGLQLQLALLRGDFSRLKMLVLSHSEWEHS